MSSSNLVVVRHPNQPLLNDILNARKTKALADALIKKKQAEIEAFNAGQLSAFNKLKARAETRWQSELVERFRNVVFNCSTKYFYAQQYVNIIPSLFDIDPNTNEPRVVSVANGNYEYASEAFNGWRNYTHHVLFYNPVNENGWLTKGEAEKPIEEFFLPQFKHGEKAFPDEVDALNISANFTLDASFSIAKSQLNIQQIQGIFVRATPNEHASVLAEFSAAYPIYQNYISDVILVQKQYTMQTSGKGTMPYKNYSGNYTYTLFLDPYKFDYTFLQYFLQHHITYAVDTYVPHNDFQDFLATAVEVITMFALFAAIIITAQYWLAPAASGAAAAGAATVSTAEATAAGMSEGLIANSAFWANVETYGFAEALEILGAETLGSYGGFVYETLGLGSFGLQSVGVLTPIFSLFSAYSKVNSFIDKMANGMSGGIGGTITTNITPHQNTTTNADDSYDVLFEQASEPDDYDIDLWIKKQLDGVK